MDSKANEPEPASLQGSVSTLTTHETRHAVIDQAFDYRGDVMIETDDGRCITGYVFDRCGDVAEPYVRVIQTDDGERITVQYDSIVRLSFTGRDTAVGKSWETWVKKYQEKKACGEWVSLEAESLD